MFFQINLFLFSVWAQSTLALLNYIYVSSENKCSPSSQCDGKTILTAYNRLYTAFNNTVAVNSGAIFTEEFHFLLKPSDIPYVVNESNPYLFDNFQGIIIFLQKNAFMHKSK